MSKRLKSIENRLGITWDKERHYHAGIHAAEAINEGWKAIHLILDHLGLEIKKDMRLAPKKEKRK